MATKECVICGVEYQPVNGWEKRQKYCGSKPCLAKAKRLSDNVVVVESISCIVCNVNFSPFRNNQTTCSKECRRIRGRKICSTPESKARKNAARRNAPIEKECFECGTKYLTPNYNKGRYCSEECISLVICRNARIKGRKTLAKKQESIQPIQCVECKVVFTPKDFRGGASGETAKYCSRECGYNNWAKQPKNKLNYSVQTAVRNLMVGIQKTSKYLKYLTFTIKELRVHMENQFDDWMNWDNHGLWHIDHIRPVASFNFTSMEDEDFKKCWALENLQPLKDTENMRKNCYYNKAKEMEQ